MSDLILVHLTDVHFNPLHKLPESAKENYHSIVADEFQELKKRVDELKKEGNVAICISGDIFNLKQQSYYVPKVVDYYSKLIEGTFSNVPVYVIPGNHDLPKSSYDLVDESAYNLLVKATKNMVDVSNRSVDVNGVCIRGVPYQTVENTKIAVSRLALKKEDFNVVLLHSDIYKSDTDKCSHSSSYITYKGVSELNENINLCLLGHIHTEYEPTEVTRKSGSSVWFSKPHAFSRMSKSYLEVESILETYPSYSVIRIKDNAIVDFKIERVQKHRASDFLNINQLKEIKERSNMFDTFIQGMREKFGDVENAFAVSNPDDVFTNMEMSNEVREVIKSYFVAV